MKKTYIIALSFLLILTIGIAINDYAKQYNLIVAEGSTPNPGHPIDQIDGLQSIIDDINNTISGLGVVGEGGSGDVNGDGELDLTDAISIARYIDGLETFTPEQKSAADYDGDGVITYYDATAIARVDIGYSREEAIRMAHSTVGIQDDDSYKIDHDTNIGGNLDVNGNLNVSGGIHVEGGSGDVDGNNRLRLLDAISIARYVSGLETFTPEQKIAADYDGDGIITYYDAYAIARTLGGENISKEEAIRMAHSTVGIQDDDSYKIDHDTNIGGNLYVSGSIRVEGGSGDVNGDGEVTIADAFLIYKYLKGTTTFTSEQKLIADVDGDGVITMSDALIATRIGYGYTKDESIKYVYSKVGPVDANLYKIDYNTKIGGSLNVDGSLNVSGGIHVEGGSGDVDGDGGISLQDGLLIIKYVAGLETFTPEQKSAADYDGNGIITDEDGKAVLFTLAECSKEEAIMKAQRGVFVSEIYESCDNTMEGYIRYNSSTKKMEYCNGSVWTNL